MDCFTESEEEVYTDEDADVDQLPPPMKMADLIRHLSDEGRRLLVAGLSPTASSSGAAGGAGAAAPPSPKASLLASIQAEIVDVQAVFGESCLQNPPVLRADESAEFVLRLRLSMYAHPLCTLICWYCFRILLPLAVHFGISRAVEPSM